MGRLVAIENASDFLDRCCPIFRADTLKALEYCQMNGALCVGITNTVGSAIARITDCGVHLNAGTEIGVASTKAYTSQMIALVLVALMLGSDRISLQEKSKEIIDGLKDLPSHIKNILQKSDIIQKHADNYKDHKSIIVMGRGRQFATSVEGALKIKEISYIHTEGIQAGELKHGPLALVDENLGIIVVTTKDRCYEKTRNAFQQVVARKGRPLVICTDGDSDLALEAEERIEVPYVC